MRERRGVCVVGVRGGGGIMVRKMTMGEISIYQEIKSRGITVNKRQIENVRGGASSSNEEEVTQESGFVSQSGVKIIEIF